MSSTASDRRIALLIDLDNAQIAAQDADFVGVSTSVVWPGPLVAMVEHRLAGRVDVRRAYGDVMTHARRVFRDKVYKARDIRDRIALDTSIQEAYLHTGFRFVHTPPMTLGDAQRAGKNGADIQLSLDAIQLANSNPHLDTFAVMSQDSDFASLVSRLRGLGRDVAIITVKRPRHHGIPALMALGTHHLVYDQQVIDEYGGDELLEVLQELRAEGKLRDGVRLNAIRALLADRRPDVYHEQLGFSSFSKWLRSILPEGLEEQQGKIVDTRVEAEPVPVVAPQEPTVSPLGTALRRVNINPRGAVLMQVADWIGQRVIDGSSPNLMEALGALSGNGISKNAVRQVWSQLAQSSSLVQDASTDCPFVERPVQAIREDYGQRVSVYALLALEDEGLTLDDEGLVELIELLLGLSLDPASDFVLEVKGRADAEAHVPDPPTEEVAHF